MNMNRAAIAILAMLAGAPFAALGENENEGGAFYWDQDLFSADNQDRNYTQGLGLAWFGKRVTSGHFVTNTARRKINDLWGLDQAFGTRPSHGLTLALTAFTPDDLTTPDPIPDDRPYAALLAFTSDRVALNSDETASLRTGFTLGILGLDLGRAMQTGLHNVFGGDRPRGWHNQISDGGEPTFLYSAEYRRALFQEPGPLADWDLSYSVGGNLGYYVNGSAGIDFRLGRIKSAFHTHNPGPLAPFDKARRTAAPSSKSKRDAYLWLRYRANLFAYNALLEGQFRDSAVTFDGGRLNRLVHELGVGVTVDVSRNCTFTFAQHVRSSDIEGPNERDHHYGGLYFRWHTGN
ncbi:MAG: lipid A deacylase LpxR family protein [Sedimenticola sp.]